MPVFLTTHFPYKRPALIISQQQVHKTDANSLDRDGTYQYGYLLIGEETADFPPPAISTSKTIVLACLVVIVPLSLYIVFLGLSAILYFQRK
jgi:hypothetical protein